MKQQNQYTRGNAKGADRKPEIRDDLDSRKNEEQDFKGDDVTHNEKSTKENHLKDKSKNKND